MWMWRSIAAALAAVVVAAPRASASGGECSSSCGTPSGLTFCSHLSFAVCPGEASWEELDQVAQAGFTQWATNETMLRTLPQHASETAEQLNHSIALMDLSNASSPCSHFLRSLQCAMHFPVCEIGRAYKRVCQASCRDRAKKTCPGLAHICDRANQTEIETKGKCFKLDYNGPAVGMWIAGFTISLIFSVLNSVGINLQKLSMTRNDASSEKKGTFKQPLWVLGFMLVCLGSILDFVAFGMAPQTLLAPLAALSLVWNMFIAPIFHKEKVTRQNIVATIIIFAGVTLTVIFAGHGTPDYELEDLVRLYKQPVMYLYVLCVGSFLAGLFQFSRYIERTHNYEGGLYHIICYGGIAGTFGGQSVLLAKSTVELFKSAIWGQSGWYMFTQLASYLIMIGLGLCLACQVHFLNGGLARFDALVVIPVYQSFWILMSVLGGIMYFEEYVSMTKTQLLMFTLGGIITITGIIVLLKTRRDSDGSESGRYVELSVTPSSAWNADDSDEEEVQLKLDSKADEDDEEHSAGAKIAPNPTRATSLSTASTSSTKSKRTSEGSEISSAIYRSSNASKSTMSPRAGRAKQQNEDDDFI
ncbi:TPA: hypothetical protein N0F65_007228 [Lagenidium giganteum]|uniref:Uncharacterized protein n=1 Tax=Lagenidium giganteum TaxID=4803 RepID=A0AAV2Z8R7_9STRA|nr:TPA: hypothetical protein N0F65_007228 [Lagenidium giganteum]